MDRLEPQEFQAQHQEILRLYEAAQRARAEAEAAEERSRRHAARVQVLADVSKHFAESSLDLTELLERICRRSAELVGDSCGVRLLTEDGQYFQTVAVYHTNPDAYALVLELFRSMPLQPAHEGVSAQVLETGCSLLIPTLPTGMPSTSPRFQRFFTEYPAHSMLLVPLAVQGRVLGILVMSRHGSAHDRAYTPDDQALMEDVAERAALAIQTATMFRAQESAIAMLREGQQALREAVKLRDEFVAIAGHELRTPLSALQLQIDNLSRVLRRQTQADGRDQTLRLVESAGKMIERLRLLVVELLDVSRITAGRLELSPGEVDLSTLVEEVAERFRDGLVRAGCTLVLDVERGIVGQWDESRLDQILTNLLSNAAKYGRGTPVDVVLRREAAFARLQVRDRGIGIAPEDQARIFDRFERAVSDRHHGGLGVGLWLTLQLVSAHGGSISVESQPEQGATFTVLLPLEPAEVTA